MFKWKRALLFLIAVSFLGYFVIKEGASSSSKKANARSQWSWVLSQTVADDGDSPEEEDESADVCVDCNGVMVLLVMAGCESLVAHVMEQGVR